MPILKGMCGEAHERHFEKQAKLTENPLPTKKRREKTKQNKQRKIPPHLKGTQP